MNKKQIIILSVILGVLAVGTLFKLWVRSAEERAISGQRAGVAIMPFDPANAGRVLISRTGKQEGPEPEPSPVELVKENNSWKVGSLWNVPADPARAETLVRALGSLSGEVRATGKKLFPDFGIRDDEAISVKIFDVESRPLSDLWLGAKQAGNGYFIRKASGEEIYFVESDMPDLLAIYTGLEEAVPLSENWADLKLFDLDPAKVTKITASQIKGDEKTLVLGLTLETDPNDPLKKTWKFIRKDMKFSPDPGKVSQFIAAMKSIKAQKVMDPAGKEYGVEDPVWQLAVTAEDGKTILNAGAKDAKEGLCHVKILNKDTVFGLAAHDFDDLNMDDTHFVKEATASTTGRSAV
jgi:hypothetical protein